MKPKQLFDLCRKAVMAWVDDYAPSMGAAISYYTIFSLAPLLVIVIAIAGALFGREAAQGQIVAQVSGLVGQRGRGRGGGAAAQRRRAGQGAGRGADQRRRCCCSAPPPSSPSCRARSTASGTCPKERSPPACGRVLRARLLSFGLILGLAFLLMVSLRGQRGAGGLRQLVRRPDAGMGADAAACSTSLISLGIITVLFAMIFKLMPTARIAWHDVWIGAAVTAVLFELGKLAIGLYLGKSGVNESFAAAGSLVVLVAWVYYAAQIFLLGAEFTKVYANEHGSVSGAKAVAATEAKAAEDAAGTDRVDGTVAVASAAAEPPPDYSRLGRTAAAQAEVDRRVAHSSAVLLRQLLLLGAVALGNALTEHWYRRQRRTARRQRARPRPRSR